MTSFIAKWRKKAIKMYGKARGLTEAQRKKVTLATPGHAKGGNSPSKSKTKRSKTKSSPTRAKRRKRTTARKKKGGRRGGRILGNVGWKGMLAGIAGLTVTKYIARRFLPVGEKYIDGAAMVGVGALGKVAKIGTANLLPAGVMMLGSSFAEDLIFGGGVGFVAGAGGYDL